MQASGTSVAALLRLARAATSQTWSHAGHFRSISTSYATQTQGATTPPPPGPPKLVVFGGRGFVGSHICKEARIQGLEVVAVSPSGTPPLGHGRWVEGVSWVRGNALEPRSYLEHLNGAAAVISCVGAFGSQAHQLKTNGTANVSLIQTAQTAAVPRFVFVSATIPNVPGIEMLMGGYVQGKHMAEDALRAAYPTTGVALRPGVIYGDRPVSAHVTLPLGLLLQPVEALLERNPGLRQYAGVPLVGALVTPPVNVQAVARAAVRAATDAAVPGGVIDAWELTKY